MPRTSLGLQLILDASPRKHRPIDIRTDLRVGLQALHDLEDLVLQERLRRHVQSPRHQLHSPGLQADRPRDHLPKRRVVVLPDPGAEGAQVDAPLGQLPLLPEEFGERSAERSAPSTTRTSRTRGSRRMFLTRRPMVFASLRTGTMTVTDDRSHLSWACTRRGAGMPNIVSSLITPPFLGQAGAHLVNWGDGSEASARTLTRLSMVPALAWTLPECGWYPAARIAIRRVTRSCRSLALVLYFRQIPHQRGALDRMSDRRGGSMPRVEGKGRSAWPWLLTLVVIIAVIAVVVILEVR